MKKIIQKPFNLYGIVLLLIHLIFPFISQSQEYGPYSFSPFVGNLVWEDSEQSTFIYRTVSMNDLADLGANQDGLIILFNLRLNTSEEMKPLVALSTEGTSGDNIIEVYYSKNTVTVRRYNLISGIRKQYDYHLFDPLFMSNQATTYQFRMYFTSNFLYLVSNEPGNHPSYYMSPLYFGLDIKDRFPNQNSNMAKYINKSSTAVIKVGDPTNSYQPYVSNLQIFGMVYGDWAKQMQASFSSPNPASSGNN